MDFSFVDVLAEDSEYRAEISPRIWLCDNHKWALDAWESLHAQDPTQQFHLFHADYHWDDLDHVSTSMDAATLRALTHAQVRELIRKADGPDGVEDPFIGYDSFIAPAVIRGYLASAHFYCLQDLEYKTGLFEAATTVPAGLTLGIHKDLDTFAAAAATPLIFDLCLDLFNHEADGGDYYVGALWDEKDIEEFFVITSPLIRLAEIVTISMSFGFSGTIEQTRALAKLALSRIQSARDTSLSRN